MALFKTAKFFCTLDLDLKGVGEGQEDKDTLNSRLEKMASSTSETSQELIPPQNPGRCHCRQCQTTSQVSHPVPSHRVSFQVPDSLRRAEQYSAYRSQEARSWSIHHPEWPSESAHNSQFHRFIVFLDDHFIVQKSIVETCWCREP